MTNDDDKKEAGTDETVDEPEEVWDILRVIDMKTETMECRMEGCTTHSITIWKCNLHADDDVWPICEACQETEFGGWPEGVVPPTSKEDPKPSNKGKEESGKEVDTASVETKENKEEGVADDEEEDEAWDIKKVMTMDDLNGSQIKCSTEICRLAAAVLFVSSGGERWYSCLDCQEADFGGWPEKTEELPITFMAEEHKALMISKCSKYKKTAMPVFVSQSPKGKGVSAQSVTPPPGSLTTNSCAAVITPAENPTKKAPKPSKEHLEMHRKWQAAAEAAGGPGSRIVLSKPIAKKLIFDYLHDSFRPMTISEVYEGLKATIPSPVLKACLDDMSLDKDIDSQFADSDDEGPAKKKKKIDLKDLQNDSFKCSLSFKAGRTSKTTLYWVDYTKTKGGNGLDAEAKAKLAGDLSQAEIERDGLQASIKTMEASTKKLLSEPTNEELIVLLAKEESELAIILEKLEGARELAVNESDKLDLKARIEHLSAFWRKRRRICMDFLVSMEEWTDGSVTMKKSLAGEGPIELESDEFLAKTAVEYARNKANTRLSGKKRPRSQSSSSSTIKPDEEFVALLMDKQGNLQRVYTDDAEMMASLKL